jgi:hypothetical protein
VLRLDHHAGEVGVRELKDRQSELNAQR